MNIVVSDGKKQKKKTESNHIFYIQLQTFCFICIRNSLTIFALRSWAWLVCLLSLLPVMKSLHNSMEGLKGTALPETERRAIIIKVFCIYFIIIICACPWIVLRYRRCNAYRITVKLYRYLWQDIIIHVLLIY